MNIQPEALGALFEMSRDPVLGIQDNLISFANPAAAARLGLRSGDPARRALPDYILSDPSDRFITSIDINEQQAAISAARQDGFTLVYIVLQEEERPVPPIAPPSEEMGTALMSIKIALDRVVSRVDADENTQLREFTCVLYHSYYRLKRLNDHLAVAFGGQRELLPSETRVEDLKTLCRDLCDTVNCVVRKDISLVFQAEEGSFLTLMDADGIEALLLNLISNSIAHMPSGGTISMALTRQGNRFVIALRDTGSGIDPAKLSGLAARELTDTTDGIGLGLPFAKHIARQHGGTIIIDATPGQGASMRVSLPQRTPDSLNTPVVRYQGKDMTNILTELSTVLDRSVYDKKFMH